MVDSQAPTTVVSVEILGSWDNFSKPYQLKRDRRTGPGQWRGCHTFENITCDGDTLNASTSRDGGLKMGGTYWYYVSLHSPHQSSHCSSSLAVQYLLDGAIEYHDPAEPSTSMCPLLPGQVVNVLDVPVQENVLFGPSRNLSSSSLDSVVFTLDPQDKYLPSSVRRASIITSAVHARKARLLATTRPMVRAQRNGLIEAEAVPQTLRSTQSARNLDKQRSLLSVFHRMRQTRSAGSNAKPDLAWPRKIFSRASKSPKHEAPDPAPETAKQPDHALSLSPTRIPDGPQLPNRPPSTAVTMYRAPTALMVDVARSDNSVHPLQRFSSSDHSQSSPPNKGEQWIEDVDAASSPRSSQLSSLSSYYTPLEQLRDTFSYFVSTVADRGNALALSDHLDRLNLAPDVAKILSNPTKMPLDEHTTVLNAIPPTDLLGSSELDSHSPKYGYADSLASYAASANFSPCLASNTNHSGLTSPCHLSELETPVMSEFGDELPPTLRGLDSLARLGSSTSSDLVLPLAGPPSKAGPPILPRPQEDDLQTSHANLGDLKGYTLPDHDHACIPTIRKLPSVAFEKANVASPFTRPESKQGLVHSWNDGSEHHMTALGELVDDLGYLGKVII